MRRRFFTALLGISLCGGLTAIVACGDDDTGGGSGTDTDAGGTGTDSGGTTKADGGSNTATDSGADASNPPTDSGNPTDATTDGDNDAGPTRTAETKSTGIITVAGFYAQARFSEDDTVVTWSNAPGCVMIVKSATKPPSFANTVKIGGAIVGSDGGTETAVELTPPDYYYDGIVLPPTSEFTVEVSENPSTPSFPELLKQTLRPSPAATLKVTAPVAADAGEGSLPEVNTTKGQPVTFAWTVPSGDVSENRFALDIQFFASGSDGSKNAEILCDGPVAAGSFTIPNELLNDAVAQTAPITSAPTSGQMFLLSGGQKIVSVKNAVYIITAAGENSTSVPGAFLIVK